MSRIGLVRATYHMYIMTNKGNVVLYTGFSGGLIERCIKHRNKLYSDSFSARYNINKLVYYEEHGDVNIAIAREKQLKAGWRKKKVQLIESMNPGWLDLFETKLGLDYLEGSR